MTISTTSASLLPAFLRQTKSEIKAKFVDLEWAQRERLLQGTQQPASPSAAPSQWARMIGEAVTPRNRYLNVEPYAANRVRLRVSEGGNDYINASPIVLGGEGKGGLKRRYIATQGPKDTSVAHFYRMLASEFEGPGRAVVVMLTQTHEAGREKCFQYYPLSEEESPMGFEEEDGWSGEVELESIEDHAESRSQIRRMRLRTSQRQRQEQGVSSAAAVAGAEESGEGGVDVEEAKEEGEEVTVEGEVQELEINHLLFTGWPDFLIPEGEDRAALINLVALSATLNASTPTSTSTSSQNASDHEPNGHTSPSPSIPNALLTDQSNPRIVHCSAGVGRSGTFIALDYLLSLLYSGELDALEEGRDPIAECVDELRKQRMMMVQGESQFNFLYEAMREAVEERAAAKGEGGGGGGGGREGPR